jgi:type II secretory pathway component GspD/PulD (secretin)
MKTILSLPITVLAWAVILSPFAVAQTKAPTTPAPSQPSEPVPNFELDPLRAPAKPASPPPASNPAKIPAAAKGEILLNFQGAQLSDVLNYLSEAAGFVIVQEVPVTGTVNIVSRQPIGAEEAVDLLNTVLVEKGFVAIRNNRILKIVNRKDALKRDLPVQTGSDPEKIPRKDEMVTQILPVRFGDAAKLVENLKPLLPESATISSNEGSNAILMTDTQTNIRRIAEIIRAIDTSVASISTIKVYPLQFANAKDLATVISQLFVTNTASSGSSRGSRDRGGGFPFPFPGSDRGSSGGSSSSADSEARQAGSRVIAVADDQSNSLIVSAPEDVIPSITDIVTRIDTSITAVTETRIFNLKHADAVEMAELLTNLYADTTTQTNNSRSRSGRSGSNGSSSGGSFPSPFGFFGGSSSRSSSSGGEKSERALEEAKVVAVGDPRTNSVVVAAARDTLMDIAEMIGRLDATDAKKQRVFVHSLEHADAESVANVLRGMLGDQTATQSSAQGGAGRLTERSANGAAMDASASGLGSSSGGRSSGGR